MRLSFVALGVVCLVALTLSAPAPSKPSEKRFVTGDYDWKSDIKSHMDDIKHVMHQLGHRHSNGLISKRSLESWFHEMEKVILQEMENKLQNLTGVTGSGGEDDDDRKKRFIKDWAQAFGHKVVDITHKVVDAAKKVTGTIAKKVTDGKKKRFIKDWATAIKDKVVDISHKVVDVAKKVTGGKKKRFIKDWMKEAVDEAKHFLDKAVTGNDAGKKRFLVDTIEDIKKFFDNAAAIGK